ncbi:hypothetical protein PFLA_a1175 [Pseudoalteromonas flavipulchra NCIMB 2033 = ATCC BAA-314]|nr:hypothetical protein [Pseudoalteromonas flavipulchra NCIMB 2033 = ATCC BAA-314]
MAREELSRRLQGDAREKSKSLANWVMFKQFAKLLWVL